MNVYVLCFRRKKNSITQQPNELALILFTCYRVNKNQLVSLFSVQTYIVVFSCLIIDVILTMAAVHCANYHHDCLTMRKNATLLSRHLLFRVFMNHQIQKRESLWRGAMDMRDGYERAKKYKD